MFSFALSEPCTERLICTVRTLLGEKAQTTGIQLNALGVDVKRSLKWLLTRGQGGGE